MNTGIESRRSPRIPVDDQIAISDVVAEELLGRLGNLSENGLLMLAERPLGDEVLYQLRFALPFRSGMAPAQIEVGAQVLWSDEANSEGMYWTGMRFISMLPEDRTRLLEWLESVPG